jgi:putative flippase GtrA
MNLSAQYFTDLIYQGKYQFYFSLLFGTLVGLIVKYILDKKYIFYYTTSNLKADIIKFILYSLMGLFTTFIFWSAELTFHFFFDFYYAKYAGGLIGLTIGYLFKYHLDKKFVFIKK